MNQRFYLIIIIAIMLSGVFHTSAQTEAKEPKFGISFSGFVKTDAFYDTRQTVSIREGHFLLYPANIKEDPDGKDLSDHPSFNILSIQSRLTGKITGPDAFGAKTSGMIEGAFFGHTEPDINGFRLRHAFIKLNWDKCELLAGQYWHPLFMVQAFPEVISFNTGVPFQPFSRNPQLRYTRNIGNLSAILTLHTQRDFTSTGPAGASSIYMRNAAQPAANFALTYSPSESKNIFGAGIDHKTLVPELETSKGYQTNTSLNSRSLTAFSKLVFDKITWKVQGIYAQNAHDITGIGGYAVKYTAEPDTVTGKREYTNFNTGTVWTEFVYSSDKWTAGLFGGFTKNMGTDDRIASGAGTVFARGSNIDYVYRVSPRVAFKSGKTTIALEVEHTTAAYGKVADMSTTGRFNTSEEVSNIRALLAFIYSF
jgi:hypothetical protein